MERERSLERSKNQMELDWQVRVTCLTSLDQPLQVRLEEMERNQYGHQEELLKTLTKARDEVSERWRLVILSYYRQLYIVNKLKRNCLRE